MSIIDTTKAILFSLICSTVLFSCSSQQPQKAVNVPATPKVIPTHTTTEVEPVVAVKDLKIKVGVTDKSYIRSKLGQPYFLSTNEYESLFVYVVDPIRERLNLEIIESSGESYNYVIGNGGKDYRFTIGFDEKGTVKDITY